MPFIKLPRRGGLGRTITLGAILSAALALPTALPASAHEYEAGALHIEHPWARATPPKAGVAGAYMVIENHGKTADRLLGGSTEAAKDVQIHSMTMDSGVMKMRQLPDGLLLPAGKTVSLSPGALHLMLIDPVKPLKEGERVPLTLRFEKAGNVKVDLAVEGMGATGPANGAAKGSHDMGAMQMDKGTAAGGDTAMHDGAPADGANAR